MKVAVIGAGFSGMLAAYLLEKKGIEVTIYEKEEVIGGHCRSIVSKDVYTELGTIFAFDHRIKELFIELGLEYTSSRFYKKYVNNDLQYDELLTEGQVSNLMVEIERLEAQLKTYKDTFSQLNYDSIHQDLLVNFSEFAKKNNYIYLPEIIRPFFSAFGFGDLNHIQAYYVFKIFDLNTLYTFLQGGKLLSLNKGMSDLVTKLGHNITDIRYGLEVKSVDVTDNGVRIKTSYCSHHYDKVLITCKLPRDVIKDDLYNQLMKKIHTNPFVACVFEVSNKDLASTYFKSQLGRQTKVQFFYTSRQHNRTIIVAYAYGHVSKMLVDGITKDLQALNIQIKHLVTCKQWFIFPHLKGDDLSGSFYHDINEHRKTSHISLIGSLVSEPSISNLYQSVKQTINELF